MPDAAVRAPRISLMLLAYNQEASARAAAESCLAQTCEPLEIVLSDDASTDGTFSQLQTAANAYRGPHHVVTRRNPTNLGIGAHYNRLVGVTAGALLVTAAGDDISVPDRVQRLAQAWDASGQRADLIASDFFEMAPDGTPGRHVETDDLAALTLEAWARRAPFTAGSTHAFTRRVMKRFGPFVDGVWYEDRIMVLRALCSGGGITLRKPLVYYRGGGSSKHPRTHTAEQLLGWQRAQTRRVLAEVRQLVQDARLAGCAGPVEAALADTLARESYLQALLEAPDVAARARLLREACDLPFDWRLRKFLTISMPAQAAALKRLKAQLRGR